MASLDYWYHLSVIFGIVDPNEYRDFTHRDFRPDHQPEPPAKRGVPYHPFLTSSQAAGSLLKVARKSKASKGNGKHVKIVVGKK